MDFNDSAEEATFRIEAAAWLNANAPSEADLDGLTDMQKAKLWQKRKSDAGWACVRWPQEYGGRSANAIEQVILNQEEAKIAAPNVGVFSIGQGMAAPTLQTWATEEQKNAICQNSPAVRKSGANFSVNPPEDRTLLR